MPENRQLPFFTSEPQEVENYSINHPIWQGILLVQDDPDQDVIRSMSIKLDQSGCFKDCPKPNIRACHCIGEIEWRASYDFADAEKCRGIKLPHISLYLLKK